MGNLEQKEISYARIDGAEMALDPPNFLFKNSMPKPSLEFALSK